MNNLKLLIDDITNERKRGSNMSQQEFWFDKKTKKNVNYLGRKNKLIDEHKQFVKICKYTEKELKQALTLFLFEQGYESIKSEDGFIYAKGNIPYCVTAHMDTVHEQNVKDTYEYNKNGDYLISSPQGIGGDDRCGIYMITELIKKGYKPYVIFCEEEEVGCVGSRKFAKTDYVEEVGKNCKYIIELDRANSNNAVYYDLDNDEFEKFITNTIGYTTAIGSCSDISYLCPATKIAGVNLSCGYYNPHTLGEYVNMTEMKRTQDAVETLFNTECEQYEYKEKVYARYGGYYNYDYSWYSDYYSKYYARDYSKKDDKEDDKKYSTMEVALFVSFSRNGELLDVCEYGTSEEECWSSFFLDNPDICFNDVLDWDLECY